MNESVKEQAALFSVLADPTRLKIITLLCQQHQPGALCVNALVGLLGISQPAISQHLRVLKSIGLVRGERRGYHVHYSVDPVVLKRFQGLILKTLSLNGPGQDTPCEGCNELNK